MSPGEFQIYGTTGHWRWWASWLSVGRLLPACADGSDAGGGRFSRNTKKIGALIFQENLLDAAEIYLSGGRPVHAAHNLYPAGHRVGFDLFQDELS